MWPALVAAVTSGLLANFLFTPPLYTWTVAEPENALAIVVLVCVAVAVSAVVDQAARRTVDAAHARAEADTLTTLAGSVLRGGDALPALLDQLREAFNLEGAALLRRDPATSRWTYLERSGKDAPSDPEHAGAAITVGEDLLLVLHGPPLSAQDLRVVNAVAVQVEALLERDRLRAEAGAARAERERTSMRTALLAAVSHDLRTPLSAIKAGVSTLRSRDVTLPEKDQQALLEDVEHSTDQLQSLIDNLLDMSRLDAGAVTPHRELVALEEVVLGAVDGLPETRVTLDVPETLPLVVADSGLLERAIANVVENAVRYSPSGSPVQVCAGEAARHIVLRVIDHGAGVPEDRKPDLFAAFQRLGDVPVGQGVGLGLAVAKGFVEANGGTLEAEDTPGGGLTMVLTLPLPDGRT
jgi:two-component system sensor histidine kinase KdpD